MNLKTTASLALLTFTLSSVTPIKAYAFGSGSSGGGGGSSNQIVDLALNIAVAYALMDPKYGPVLMSLGITSAEDVKKLLSGDLSGANLNSIIAYFITKQSKKNPEVVAWLDKLGIKTFNDLKRLISGGGAYERDTLFSLAYTFAASNPKYAPWLAALGIRSGADLGKLLKGGINGSNLQNQLIAIGIAYLIQKKKLGSNADALFPALNLGAFQGLPIADVQAITKLTKK